MALTFEEIIQFKCCHGVVVPKNDKCILSRGLTFHASDCPVMVGMRVYNAYRELPYDNAVVLAVEELTKWRNGNNGSKQ